MNFLPKQIQFIGVLFGTLLMAPLSDRFGRKPVGLTCLTFGLTLLAMTSLSPTGYILLMIRFIVAILMGGSLVVIATYTMEIIPSEHRITLRTFCNWVREALNIPHLLSRVFVAF